MAVAVHGVCWGRAAPPSAESPHHCPRRRNATGYVEDFCLPHRTGGHCAEGSTSSRGHDHRAPAQPEGNPRIDSRRTSWPCRRHLEDCSAVASHRHFFSVRRYLCCHRLRRYKTPVGSDGIRDYVEQLTICCEATCAQVLRSTTTRCSFVKVASVALRANTGFSPFY